MEDRCIFCDAVIPEGRWICKQCELESEISKDMVDNQEFCTVTIPIEIKRNVKIMTENFLFEKYLRKTYGPGYTE